MTDAAKMIMQKSVLKITIDRVGGKLQEAKRHDPKIDETVD